MGLHNTQSTQKQARLERKCTQSTQKQARLERKRANLPQKEKSPYSARAFLSAHANWSGQDVGLGPH